MKIGKFFSFVSGEFYISCQKCELIDVFLMAFCVLWNLSFSFTARFI